MRPKYTPEQRIAAFWNKVAKSDDPNGCWLWTGGTGGRGYGHVLWEDGYTLAHRASYLIAHESIPDGLMVLHNCPDGDNPACVNPAHLFLGTHQDNMEDRQRKGRTAHGETHGARLHPETRPRGEKHWHYTHPNNTINYAKGESRLHHKLTEESVRLIRARYALGGVKQIELAQEYQVDQSLISRVLLRKAWKHIP